MKKIIVGLSLSLIFSAANADVEDWYLTFGIGVAKNSYPPDLANAIKTSKQAPGVESAAGSLDMLGGYFPVRNDRAIAGIALTSSFDRLDNNTSNFQITQYLIGASYIEFFGKEIGDGFLLRADGGVAYAIAASNKLGNIGSNYGVGGLVGVGYGIPVSKESRILFSINFSAKHFDKQAYTSGTFGITGLW